MRNWTEAMNWRGRGDLRKLRRSLRKRMWSEIDQKIQDNGHDQLDWVARNALKSVNLPLNDYWSKSTHPVVENPILNAATLLKHTGCRVLLKMKHYSP